MPKLRWVQAVGVLAILWNGAGVFSYLAHVGLIGDGGALPGDAKMPAAVTACFAVGVFGGLAGSVALAMSANWARPLLWLSWIGTVIDWFWVFGWNDAASWPLGITVLLFATFFASVAEWATRQAPARP